MRDAKRTAAPVAPETGGAGEAAPDRTPGHPLNRHLFIADNYDLLRGLPTDSIDLVVTDPPFGTTKTWKAESLKPPLDDDEISGEVEQLGAWGISNRREALAEGIHWPEETEYPDMWEWDEKVHPEWMDRMRGVHGPLHDFIWSVKDIHSDDHAAYLAYMSIRLMEIERVLKPTGSIYLHCDHAAGHYLKVLMDSIFGEEWFRNEIVWCYAPSGRAPKRGFHRKHDIILYYAAEEGRWNAPFTEMTEATLRTYNKTDEKTGRRYGVNHGKRTYLDTLKGRPVPSWWVDIPSFGTASNAPERTGYPTQKPKALAERMIKASSNPGDVVLDPFAGCAYVPVVAEGLGRQWIACDISARALTVVKRQFAKFGYSADGAAIPKAGDDQLVMLATCDVKVRGPGDVPEPYVDPDPEPEPKPPPPPVDLILREPVKYKGQLYSREDALEYLLSISGWQCWGCGQVNTKWDPDEGEKGGWVKVESIRNFEADHIDPKSSGGKELITNMAPLCRACNGLKGRHKITLHTLREWLEEGGLMAVPTEALPVPGDMLDAATRWHADKYAESLRKKSRP